MQRYINAGVYIAGVRPQTRQELIDAMTHRLYEVFFDPHPYEGQQIIKGTQLPDLLADGTRIWVAGPDPIERHWSALIRLEMDGIEVV